MVDKIWYNMEELIGGSEERGINRNILECKAKWRDLSGSWHCVLIETYWNVKCIIPQQLSWLKPCINRNILECKEYFPEFVFLINAY